MTGSDFKHIVNAKVQGGLTDYMQSFDKPVADKPIVDAQLEIDDFAVDDWDDSSEETETFAADDFAVDDWGNSSEESQDVTEVSKHGIVDIPIVSAKRVLPVTIEDEITEFLESHLCDRIDAAEDQLYLYWNNLYNDDISSNEEMIKKYLAVRYALFFESKEAMQIAVNTGLDFIHNLRFCRRMLTEADLNFFRANCEKEFYDQSVFDELSNNSNFNVLLLSLLEKKIETTCLYKYRGNSLTLLYAIKLLLADKFDEETFDAAISSGVMESYAKECLEESLDRFGCIRMRNDFAELYKLILNLEGRGRVIRQEVLEKYAKAFYLRAIIMAESESRLNEDFVSAYLLNDLGKNSFVADIYEKGEVNLNFDTTNFTRAKILTDVAKLELNPENFQPVYIRAMQCLLASRFTGSLSEEDYKKFLAIMSFNQGKPILEKIEASDYLIGSYNQFWMEDLLSNLNLDFSEVLTDDIMDNIIYFKIVGNKRRSYYLQLDQYIFDSIGFLELIGDAASCKLISRNAGLVLMNQDFIQNVNFQGGFMSDSSLTRWAKNEVPVNYYNQFSKDDQVQRNNLLTVMADMTKQLEIRKEFEGGANAGEKYKMSSLILKFAEMPLSEYYQYDKMFSFISKNSIYLGLLHSKRSFEFLCLFSKSFRYDCDSKIIFQFLSYVFSTFFKEKLEIYARDFKKLNPNRPALFIRSRGVGEMPMKFRVLIDSIDNLMVQAAHSQHIVLNISVEGSILLSF